MKRAFMILLVIAMLLSVGLTGCGTGQDETTTAPAETTEPTEADEPTETTAEETTSGTDQDVVEYKESPMLQEQGLPPVSERLPLEPKLTNEMPPELLDVEIGTYGGTLRLVTQLVDNDQCVFILFNEPLINTPGLLGKEVTGNILKGYDVSADQQEFTFYLREGLKWSDGEPVTMEDIQFAVEDVLLNTTLTPAGLPAWLKSGGKGDGTPMTFEVIDPLTFKISFDAPYGMFLMQLAVQGWRGYTDLLKPKHFLTQYHADYTPLEELEPQIAEEGFAEGAWNDLFNLKDIINWEVSSPDAVGFPTLSPWMQVSRSGGVIEYHRNPYYFKIDAEGNQLPYIDKITSTYVPDLEMVSLKILSGEVDHSYEFVSMPKVPLFKESAEEAGYEIYLTELHRTACDLNLNMTYDDPAWREVVQDIRFRTALNLALDKQEIADTVFYGFGQPAEVLDTTYDLDQAKQILDEMGMTVGSDGFRVGLDGKRFSIPIEVPNLMDYLISFGELVAEQWKLLDIDVSVRVIDSALWGERNSANELQATVIWAPGPVQWHRSEWSQQHWGQLWHRWWTSGGTEGEEPPEEVKAFYQMILDVSALPLDEAIMMGQEIRDNMGENIWFFITTERVAAPVAVNSQIRNFSDKGWGIAHNFGGEQWFYE